MGESHPREQGERKPPGVRERILDAALEILRESGLHRLTQVQVARRAGVRQSHLTYYFPTRDALLEAVAAAGVDGIADALRGAVGDEHGAGHEVLLERLAAAVADLEHMRIFVAMIVEADGDPAVRDVMRSATHRMEAALAEALEENLAEGGRTEDSHAIGRARVVLAAVWGLGLYEFLMRPAPEADMRRRFLTWLATGSGARREPTDDQPTTRG